jgi:hypothetical protein
MENTQNIKRIDPIEKLFVNWHNGDKTASEQMADRFDLWFDALTTFYLGSNSQKDSSYQKVCKTFSGNIQKIKKSRDLVPFAHEILSKELSSNPGTTVDDFTNAMLNQKPAAELLNSVWNDLTPTEQASLLQVYGASNERTNTPFIVLSARNKLKSLLQQQCGVEFISIVKRLERDLCPLPLYEGNKLLNAQEAQYFERWLLNAPNICQEILEFSPFAHALRNGAIKEVSITPEITVPEVEITDVLNSAEEQPEITHYDREESSTNALLKPIIVAAILFFVIVGLWILVQSS